MWSSTPPSVHVSRLCLCLSVIPSVHMDSQGPHCSSPYRRVPVADDATFFTNPDLRNQDPVLNRCIASCHHLEEVCASPRNVTLTRPGSSCSGGGERIYDVHLQLELGRVWDSFVTCCLVRKASPADSSSKKTRAHLFFMQGRVCVLPEDALACLCFTQPLSVSAPCPFCTASGLSPIQLSWSCSVHQTARSAWATSQTRRPHSVLEESTDRSVLSHRALDLAKHFTKSKSYAKGGWGPNWNAKTATTHALPWSKNICWGCILIQVFIIPRASLLM